MRRYSSFLSTVFLLATQGVDSFAIESSHIQRPGSTAPTCTSPRLTQHDPIDDLAISSVDDGESYHPFHSFREEPLNRPPDHEQSLFPFPHALLLLIVWFWSNPALAATPTSDSNLDIRYFIAGGSCAAISHGLTVPLDVIKTTIQAQGGRKSQQSLGASIQTMLQESDVPLGSLLTSGLAPTVVGYGLEGAAKFGLYESFKHPLSQAIDQSTGYLLASVVAGAAASVLLCPLEQIRIRMVTDASFASLGLIRGGRTLIQQEGLASVLWGGFPAMLSKQVPYTFGKQVSFDVFCGGLYSWWVVLRPNDQPSSLVVDVVAAAGASMIACLLSHPGDVLLTDTFKKRSNEEEIPAITSVATLVYQQEGWTGFFSGLTARFFHVGAIITSQLVLYDLIKQLLGLPATGST